MGGKWSLGRGSKYIAMSAALGIAPHYLLLEAQSHGGVPSSWHRCQSQMAMGGGLCGSCCPSQPSLGWGLDRGTSYTRPASVSAQ